MSLSGRNLMGAKHAAYWKNTCISQSNWTSSHKSWYYVLPHEPCFLKLTGQDEDWSIALFLEFTLVCMTISRTTLFPFLIQTNTTGWICSLRESTQQVLHTRDPLANTGLGAMKNLAQRRSEPKGDCSAHQRPTNNLSLQGQDKRNECCWL